MNSHIYRRSKGLPAAAALAIYTALSGAFGVAFAEQPTGPPVQESVSQDQALEPAPTEVASESSREKDGLPMNTPAQLIRLPAPKHTGEVSVEEALWKRRSIREYASDPLTLEQVGQLLWSAQGITDPANGFRTAPSAGATYPLEVYLLAGRVEGLSAGFYRYSPRKHALVKIREGDGRVGLSGAALGQEMIRKAPASMVFTGVVARTAERYGERALRYVYLEAGHAAENVCLQCVTLRLGTVVMGAFDDASVSRVLDLSPEESPLYIMPVGVVR